MYFKYARSNNRRSNVKISHKRVTLNHLDAVLKCYTLITKMARLRFPGRPGQRIGKNYVTYLYDDFKLGPEAHTNAPNKIQVGLKLFYDLFGYSDEEEDFEGFTLEDIALAKAIVSQKLKKKEAVLELLDSYDDFSSPSTSDIDRLFPSDSDVSTSSSVRRERGMRNIQQISYDKLLKDGLDKSTIYSSARNFKLGIDSLKPNQFQNASKTSLVATENAVEETVKSVKEKPNFYSNSNPSTILKSSDKKSLSKKFSKTTNKVKIRRKRRSLRPNVKKKLKNHFGYTSKNKFAQFRKNSPKLSESNRFKCNKFQESKAKISSDISTICSNTLNSIEMASKSKRLLPRYKQFILPSMSVRSSRKIYPRKRYIDSYDDSSSKKPLDEDSQCSQSSLSGSSETISAMDGGSSPDYSQTEDCTTLVPHRKVGLLERPLVVQGKRAWKPSLKVQMKLSAMNYEYPFALKKSDDSSGTATSSGSFKDIIKPDMVSKYAEKMAQKPKERPFKILESFKRNSSNNYRNEVKKDDVESSDNLEDENKPGDKLEKVAAKIEKLLKSQWEGRLNDSNKPAMKMSQKLESSVTEWKNVQDQRTSNQKRTKTIIRKARLQLKKRNLNLRTRKIEDLSNSACKDSKSCKKDRDISSKHVSCSLSETLISNQHEVSSEISNALDTEKCVSSNEGCIICHSTKLAVQSEELCDQLTCRVCFKFFKDFSNTPKQYFCLKDGNCVVDCRKEVSHKAMTARCKACWVKICLLKLTISSPLKNKLIQYIPRLDLPPHDPIMSADSLEESKELVEGNIRGPRIKHVCRRAAVALGLPRATFSEVVDTKESFNLSALPKEEKQKILETVPTDERSLKSTENDALSPEGKASFSKIKKGLKKKPQKGIKIKNRLHLDLLKKSSLLIQKEQKRRKLLLKKSMKQLRKHSLKKSFKLGERSEIKKTLKFSYKSAVKTSLKNSPKANKRPTRTKKLRKVRCKQCAGCMADDCGECAYCLDKKKFGGPNLIKQACMYRRCLRPMMPASERKIKSTYENSDNRNKLSQHHSSFGSDGPSRFGLSLSSSSSPTSPDASSCGSSCSTSSTSSSGSSTSSSSSQSSSSSSSSSSDNITVPHNNSVGDNYNSTSFMQQIISGPVISECTDNKVVTNTVFQEQASKVKDQQSVTESGYNFRMSEVIGVDATVRESGDTIFYDDSSSIIELKNASFDPSLIYGAPMGNGVSGEQSLPASHYYGSRRESSRQNENEIHKGHQSRELDQYGSAGSGGQESDDDYKEDDIAANKKHYIYADYWGDYEFEKISSQGFPLISSHQIPLPCVCFLCGSAGEEKLLFCVLCCEPYHTFCLAEDDIPNEENLENWCCKRCQCCAVCGSKKNLLKCKKCHDNYHAECLTPHYPTKLSKKKRIWMCPKCVKCKSCGTTSPNAGAGLIWNFDLLLCQPCVKLTDKGNFCPVCGKCYEENDYESEMVQCYKCSRWVHAKCDNISDEWYEILSCLPETVVYTCFRCTVEVTPTWMKAIREYLKHGLKTVLNSLLTARCARHLIRRDCSSPSIKSSDSESGKITSFPESRIIPELSVKERDSERVSKETNEIEATVNSLVKTVDSLQIEDSNILNAKQTYFCGVQRNLVNEISNSVSTLKHDNDSKKIPDLLLIKRYLEIGKYTTIASFFDDILIAIEAGNNKGMKHHTSETKSVLIKQTEKIFPWFKVPSSKIWQSKADLPKGMLPNAVIPPYTDHAYAHYIDHFTIFPSAHLKNDLPCSDYRACILCGYTGDSKPKKCGRLLYCGQDDWIHVNCALWSAEVFKQQDGSLRNVYPAMSRGLQMHCEFCSQLGATVGCCVRGCPANYHFYCARKDEALLQEDRKIFCALHKDYVDEKIVDEDEFQLEHRLFVHQQSIHPKWVKKKWQNPIDKDTLQVVIGSLTIQNLGHLTALSNNACFLVPVDFECTRLFWSTKNPNLRVKYTCRVTQILPKTSSAKSKKIYNTTTIHCSNECFGLKDNIGSQHQHKDIKEYRDLGRKIKHDVKQTLNRVIKKVTKNEQKFNWNIENLCQKNNIQKIECLNFNGNRKKHCLENNKLRLLNLEGQRDNIDSNDFFSNRIHNNSNWDNMSEEKRKLLLRSCEEKLFKNLSKRNEFNKFNKRMRTPSFDNNEMVSAKLMRMLSDKQISKDRYDLLLQRYEEKGLSPEIKSLLNSITPGTITETVLPIFSVSSKENPGIAESSGYSSNDDGHLRRPSLPLADGLNKENCVAFGEKSAKSNSAFQIADNTKIVNSTWKKDIQFNGNVKLTSKSDATGDRNSDIHSSTKTDLLTELLLEKAYGNDLTFNGRLNDGPFKCTKCKRIYRTHESYKKHTENCNFSVDSSSDDESADLISSDSNDSAKVKNNCTNNNSDLNYNNETSALQIQDNGFNLSSLGTSLNAYPDLQSQQNNANFESASTNSKAPFSSNSEFKSRIIMPGGEVTLPSYNSINSPANIQYDVDVPQVISNVTVNNNASLPVMPNTYNIGYNTVCNEPSSNLSIPCNTLIIPPNPNQISVPVPQSNFMPSPIELTPGSQLSYVGSITITNNETMSLSVNVPDQIIPVFPQQNINFGAIPNSIQLQHSEYLSSVNVQHISVHTQSTFQTNTINQIVFPPPTVNFPQNQIMYVEEPVTHFQTNQPPSYMIQVPVEPTCSYTTYPPQQGMAQQFVNQYPLHTQHQQIASQPVIYQQPTPFPAQVQNQIPVSNTGVNYVKQSTSATSRPESVLPTLLPKPNATILTPPIAPTPDPPQLTKMTSPSPDQTNKNLMSSISVPPNSNIVEILKKAAEQMISIAAKKKEENDAKKPENKTRFAHTRKVAARKAEKLRRQQGLPVRDTPSPNKQKSVRLNIARLTPRLNFIPVASIPKSTPIPLSEDQNSSRSPSVLSTDTPVETPQAQTPSATESNSDIFEYEDFEDDSPLLRTYMQEMAFEGKEKPPPKDKPYLLYEINSEDGLHVQSTDPTNAWKKVYDELQDTRIAARMNKATLSPEDLNGYKLMGLDNPALVYLLEQLPGAEQCPDYEFIFHRPAKDAFEVPENLSGCARSEGFFGRREYDMFNFLASEFRSRPVFLPPEDEEEGAQKGPSSRRSVTNLDMPIAMRFKFLKTIARETVGVYRSSIHGRGLFCKRNIDPGELVIEYAGEVIRSVLTDKRERIYQSKGIGCYMFRIDDDEVVDATMHGNAARFINHSCEPNCFSKVVTVDGKKHIVIFALRRIIKGEELTYDYKFPFEDEKIPCHCNSRRCRKYLN